MLINGRSVGGSLEMITDGMRFEHDGFECVINERPDLLYMFQVYGHREVDNVVFKPNLLFNRNLNDKKVITACVAIMDGDFSGTVYRYGRYNVME